MIKLRIAGAASILALVLALALFTTGAFAQRAQVDNATSAYAGKIARIYTGGGPLPTTAPAAPAPVRAAPKARVVRRVRGVCCASYGTAYASSSSVLSGFGGGNSFGGRGGFFGGNFGFFGGRGISGGFFRGFLR